jgi:hypothetical protein
VILRRRMAKAMASNRSAKCSPPITQHEKAVDAAKGLA